MDTAERDRVMKAFREGKVKVLISTNLVARGIDVPGVNIVINFDLPMLFTQNRNDPVQADSDTYIHRVGRTGRAGSRGVAINLVSPLHKSASLIRFLKSCAREFTTRLALDFFFSLEYWPLHVLCVDFILLFRGGACARLSRDFGKKYQRRERGFQKRRRRDDAHRSTRSRRAAPTSRSCDRSKTTASASRTCPGP